MPSPRCTLVPTHCRPYALDSKLKARADCTAVVDGRPVAGHTVKAYFSPKGCAQRHVVKLQSHARRLSSRRSFKRSLQRKQRQERLDAATQAVAARATQLAHGTARAAQAAWRFGVRWHDNFVARLDAAEQLLPSQAAWDALRPAERTAFLQGFLTKDFTLEARARRAAPAAASAGALDKWQQAAAVPLLRVREMLIVADTGTGKSFAWAHAARLWYDQGIDVVVLVNDAGQAANQLGEFRKSPSWQDVPVDEVVSTMNRSSRRRVRIVTYAQAGNAIRDGDTQRTLDGAAIIIDEVHNLATPEDNPRWADSVRAVGEYLAKRRYGRLLGLTATPLVDLPSLVTLLGYFTPEGMRPVGVDDFEVQALAPTGDEVACGAAGRTTIRASLERKLGGVQLFYYSADRDRVDFASFAPPEVLHVDVRVDGPDTFSVARPKGWTPAGLAHHTRLQRIVDASAPSIWERLQRGAPRKTLVFMSTKGMARALFERLHGANAQAGGAHRLLLLTDDASAEETNGVKREFGAAADNTVLVTHARFAVGHTFDDRHAPARRGARRVISVQFRTLKDVMQMEGRLRRRQAHAAYDDDVPIERVVVIPRAVVAPKPTRASSPGCSSKRRADCAGTCEWRPGKGCVALPAHAADDVAPPGATPTEVRRTCEHVFHEAVLAERGVFEAIMRALYLVSYGRVAFWNLRPGFVEEEEGASAEPPTATQRVARLLQASGRRALDYATKLGGAGWDAFWYE